MRTESSRQGRIRRTLLAFLLACSTISFFSRKENSTTLGDHAQTKSMVSVTHSFSGPLVIKTSAAEFDVLPTGYVQSHLLKDGTRLTLDDPGQSAETLQADSRELHDFILDLDHPTVSATQGKLGPLGKRVELRSRSASGIEKAFTVEVYDNFPTLAIIGESLRNVGPASVRLDQVVANQHRLNASLTDPQAPPYRLWSFQGSSEQWGKDDVVEISKNFTQPNVMGAMTPHGQGGGIPVVAFWTGSAGEAIGHLETLPWVISLPVKVAGDGRISVSMNVEAKTVLKPGEVYSLPRSFVAVYSGDFYEPLRLYSRALQLEGLTLGKPNAEDYNISWCGWGYESEVTPAQMLGTIPKLKEFNIHWATLDDRWFENYGDWEPRHDTFPGDAIKKMVDDFHRQGIHVQIWWLPLGVENGEGKRGSYHYGLARVVKEHPDWLILNQDGKPAHMARGLAALCPALPAVQDYYKELTRRFIRDWGFDGHKLDNVFTVPACYNPAHHHKSPEDSIRAMGEVYRAIFETTRQLKPESVTQVCSCGTPPNLAWLPYLDQAVTADPVGSAQVRRRIKMFKALLGPRAAVYGDHVELTSIRYEGEEEIDEGKDFASTLGAGGVVGTKFVWPDPGPYFKTVLLTPEKESLWKKWIDLYNAKMLSKGTFLDLYVMGYDDPEGYAIEKDGKMYYAFFAVNPTTPWKGEIELRGLAAGKYRVLDYENGKDLGTIVAPNAMLATEFTHHILLEVSRL
ncbi:MAG TPA: alpha-galactosidase [Terriglobia bacterium]|nr:alpha-galactosidase [Terriglobia bacterium]